MQFFTRIYYINKYQLLFENFLYKVIIISFLIFIVKNSFNIQSLIIFYFLYYNFVKNII